MKEKHLWNAKCANITTAYVDAVLIYYVVPYSVKVYQILPKAK